MCPITVLRKLQQFQPTDRGPGIEDVKLPEEAESELDEDDLSEEEGDGSESVRYHISYFKNIYA